MGRSAALEMSKRARQWVQAENLEVYGGSKRHIHSALRRRWVQEEVTFPVLVKGVSISMERQHESRLTLAGYMGSNLEFSSSPSGLSIPRHGLGLLSLNFFLKHVGATRFDNSVLSRVPESPYGVNVENRIYQGMLALPASEQVTGRRST